MARRRQAMAANNATAMVHEREREREERKREEREGRRKKPRTGSS
jgi:hypothetical protein